MLGSGQEGLPPCACRRPQRWPGRCAATLLGNSRGQESVLPRAEEVAAWTLFRHLAGFALQNVFVIIKKNTLKKKAGSSTSMSAGARYP